MRKLFAIDDEPDIGEFIVKIAKRAGFKAECSTHPDPFRKRLRAGWPDVIVLDLHMPQADGIELLHEIAELHPVCEVIIVSGHGSRILSTAERLANEHGVKIVATLPKPFRAKTLRSVLENLSSQSNWLTKDAILNAIEEQQFKLHYQPKVKLTDGTVAGFEGLIRWDHPERGLLAPDSFLGFAESNSAMVPLTKEVIRLAFSSLAEWRDQGLDTHACINFSASTISSSLMLDHLVENCNKTGIEPSAVTVEITETAVMSNVVRAMETLTRMRLKGFGLAIDDFGTGYSSLQQLQRLPFTEMKIDRAFIMDYEQSADSRAIVKAIIGLAHNLGEKVVAEGIESKSVMDALADMGCDEGQGFYIAKPMEAGKVPAWVKKWNADEAAE